ncbi:hypothetical protein M0802_004182 [Mischocyttarus mexicanus]|nr:hypothetical protein M0802_004182 [Mischocyttarus mexicanus]
MSETVVTMDNSSNNAANNPRQVPTVKTEPGQPSPLAGIRLNLSYFRTIPGIIKLVQLIGLRTDIFKVCHVNMIVLPWNSAKPSTELDKKR